MPPSSKPTPAEPFETAVGRERRPLTLTFAGYQRWLSRIRADRNLMEDMDAVHTGARPMLDLDEGGAGIFPGRIHPCADRIRDRLDWLDAADRAVIASALLPFVIEDIAASD